jgi:mannose-6-phosphate isomerase-like protein (cupin superfamily)
MDVVDLREKFDTFDDTWNPRIDEDELVLVVDGTLRMELRDRELTIQPGQFVIVPRGVEHRPVADDVVHVVLIEPQSTVNTGNVTEARTRETLEWV